MNVGLLTSGGDCAGLNAVMCGFVKAIAKTDPDINIFGFKSGFAGLVKNDYRKMKPDEFFGILNSGGTILGTSRQPYKKLLLPEDSSKVTAMIENYRSMKLDVLVILGGRGTHRIAALLSREGLNVIGIPKTIDNDVFGTDETFGFHSAVSVATECVDRIRTTAASHERVMLVEIMGNRAGWLTLYTGLAGNADIVLIPEIPFNTESVVKAAYAAINRSGYGIIVVAEGAMDIEEALMTKKIRYQKRAARGDTTVTNYVAELIAKSLCVETRVVIPGHTQRGGNPTAYDRVICTQMGAHAAKLAQGKIYGVTVAKREGKITYNQLADIADNTKFVPPDHELIRTARDIGISFGDS